jgi:hypothetical protein
VTTIDWSTQLKKIERQFEGLPPEPTESDLRAKRENERREQLKRKERGAVFSAVFSAASRVVLVVSLSVAMNAWPYDRACGVGLGAYLAAAGLIVAGGLWATVGAWHRRAPLLHALALLTTAWGVVLITAQALPRVGYARTDPANGPAWRCWRDGQASVGVPVASGWLKQLMK